MNPNLYLISVSYRCYSHLVFTAGLITFRETLEAALVVGIVLTFLVKTNQLVFRKYVIRGIVAGIMGAVFLAILLEMFFGGLSGKTEEIFEGILMFVTAGFLSWMILWVHRQQEQVKKIKEKIIQHVQNGYGFGIFVLIASTIWREGTETVLYLKATSLTGASNQLFGAFLGIIVAMILSFAIFKWAMQINLQKVFTVTSIFLLLFAAGMIAHGVHEFQEAGLLPIFGFDPIVNIAHILDHKSVVGSFLRTLFGYTSKPTILEIISYATYIGGILCLERITDRMRRLSSKT